jgi:hypothetical protein
MTTTYAFRFAALSVKIKEDAILWWLEKVERLRIKEILAFLVLCRTRIELSRLETLTIISSPSATILIWCQISWNVIKT